jgi:hypothetical protein
LHSLRKFGDLGAILFIGGSHAQGKQRCGASSVISIRYGATSAHSSSLTSLG